MKNAPSIVLTIINGIATRALRFNEACSTLKFHLISTIREYNNHSSSGVARVPAARGGS